MTRKLYLVVVPLAALATAPASTCTAQGRDPFREARLKLVSESIEREGVKNPRVLSAMRTIPRHEFVPLGLRPLAYHDSALAIGFKQTISPPFIVAYMTEALDPQPDDMVLEIGTGSGYQAAVLSPLVKQVFTIEIVEPLGKQATERLKRLNYDNVQVKIGDGYLGWPEHAPFDKIIVTCSPENIPQPLVEQLKEGGKLIIPVGERYRQMLHLLEKRGGELKASRLINTVFVPMTGESEVQRQVRPDPLKPQVVNAGFDIDENGDGYPDAWHYTRQVKVVAGEGPDGSPCAYFENVDAERPSQALQAMAIDGRKIGSLQVKLHYKLQGVRAGSEKHEKPAAFVHFYDDQRQVIAEPEIGPWLVDTDWKRVTATVAVPQKAREMIVRIGLNGATGKLWVDDFQVAAQPR